MDFDLADKAAGIALTGVAAGWAPERTWGEITACVLPHLPQVAHQAAERVDLAEDVDALVTQLTRVLQHEPPEPKVNGLYFGIAELVAGDEDAGPDPNSPVMFTLYVSGSARYKRTEEDWPCDPAWWPEHRYFDIPAFTRLSKACPEGDTDAAWLVATGLIEPLSIVLVGEACRRVDAATLLGTARSRGIGSGFDSGELRDIGKVTKKGFEPHAPGPDA